MLYHARPSSGRSQRTIKRDKGCPSNDRAVQFSSQAGHFEKEIEVEGGSRNGRPLAIFGQTSLVVHHVALPYGDRNAPSRIGALSLHRDS